MARGRSANYDQQRDEILARAAELFANRGYTGTSMNEVAAACGVTKPALYHYVRDKYVRSYDINTGSDIGLLSVRKFGSPYVPPRTLSYNPAERAVVLTISSDNGLFELTALPKDAVGEVKDSSTDGKRESGQAAILVARNRFAVLNKAT